MTGLLRESIKRSFRAKMGGLLLRPAFTALKERISPRRLGGAPLLGVNGVVVIAHGRSDAEAIEGAIKVASLSVKANLTDRLEQGISGWHDNGD